MHVKLLSIADTALYAEALSTVLANEPWVATSVWVQGLDGFDAAAAELRPDVVLVMCPADRRPAWIRAAVRRTGAIVVGVGVSTDDHDVVACAEAGARGYVFCDQSITEVRDVVQAALRGEVLCPARVTASLLDRVRALAGERRGEARLRRLTTRELQILRLIREGRSNKEIAVGLHIDLCTVKNHVHHILEKLEVSRRGEAAALAT